MFAPQKITRFRKSEKIIPCCTHDLFKDDFFDSDMRNPNGLLMMAWVPRGRPPSAPQIRRSATAQP
jgi:hypothetical protein